MLTLIPGILFPIILLLLAMRIFEKKEL